MIMNLKQFLRNHLALVIPYSLILLSCIVLLIFDSKVDIQIYINRMNSPFLDFFFKYMTLFGTFSLIAPIIIWLAFIRYRYALTAVASSLLAVLITQVLKRLICYDSGGPSLLMKGMYNLHFVDNVQILTNHSFPSGHSSGAFALFVVLAIANKHPFYQFLFLMVAVLVGYSRLYLSQHFLSDVVAGSVIGVLSAFVCYFSILNINNKSGSILDKSILSSLRLKKY